MRNVIRISVAAVSLAAGLAFASSVLADVPASMSAGAREITVKPNTKYVDVNDGETVKIVDTATGKSFVWTVDTPSWGNYSLNQVDPVHALDHVVTAVVSNNWDVSE